ncbi:MRPS27 [Cordylochernes scorpioides]|uniref:MRPS27 n=1 Tax=Cordylochernes scorpioides TaxID=51811 RepID=A0ABY6KW83_9ARAC|nr:MRPS27 [Cordylochernes scorpioides]
MLQEDFNSHPLSTHMALYSCLKYMEDPAAAPWEEEKAPEEDEEEKSPAQEAQGMDDDEDEQVVRVPFLYEPHHDDHFDLDDPQKILGKTLNLAGMAIDTPAGRACQIWGIGMYGKWEEAATIDLPRLVEAGNPILAEGVEKFRKYLSEVEDEELRSQWTEKLEPLLSKLHTVPGDILPALEQDLNQLVATKEAEYISLQEKTYQEWIEARQAKWDKQVEDYEMVKRRKLIEQRKKELKDKEELLSFFDNWDKIHLELEKATAELNKEKLEKEEEYIVPEVKSWQRKMQEQAKEQDHISNANFD